MICYWYQEPLYIFFHPEMPALVYYAHIPTALIALLIGLFVLWNGRGLLLNRLLFAITLTFSLWTFINLVLWTNIHSDILLFAWSLTIPLQALISVFSIYFMRVYVTHKDVTARFKVILLALLLPILFLAPTSINVSGFDIAVCDAFLFEGYVYQMYYVLLSVVAILWILGIVIKGYRTAPVEQKGQILVMGIGIELFLFIFFSILFLAQYLTVFTALDDSSLEMYGLFGMDIFAITLAYLIVKFKAFNAKLFAVQALVTGLSILVATQFFYTQSAANLVIISVTLLGTLIGGYFLVRSVKREVEQREQIEKLATNLEKANERLKELDKMKSEFVSIASHQLRSPITAIRGYVSMLVEGSYGKFPDKAQEVLERIGESSKFMATSIEDYLNVSRIEAGNMKYELSDFNLKEQAEKVSDELRQVAMKKGLVLVFRSGVSGSGMVHADIGKVRQVIMNFIDNSIKYTPKGTVTVVAHDDPKQKKMWITISDTGIGMSKETLSEVFDKFVRAKNANQVNVTGTGLGLFVAKKMATGMGGKVWGRIRRRWQRFSIPHRIPRTPRQSKSSLSLVFFTNMYTRGII